MELYSPLHKTLKPLAIAVLGAIALISCSSSQTVYDEDGIYSNPASETEVVVTENSGVTSTGVAYKNYFDQKADALDQIPEDGAIFTDIESYTSTEGDLEEEYIEDYAEGTGYRVGNASWGEEVSSITVNVYPSYAGGYWGGGYGFNRFGYGGFGGGWGYYDPFYGSFYNGFGFGYGYAAVWNPFCYGYNRPYYNRPYYNNYNNNYYNNGYGGRNNNVAYSRGRRNSASSAIAASRTRLRESGRRTTASRSVYSRDRGTARPSSSRGRGTVRPSATRPSNSARPSRPSATRPATRPSRPSVNRPRATRPSTTRPRGNARPASRPSRPTTTRPRTSSRPNSNARPSSSSRSKSSVRSSSSRSSSGRSSSRSGGTSRRGGGSI